MLGVCVSVWYTKIDRDDEPEGFFVLVDVVLHVLVVFGIGIFIRHRRRRRRRRTASGFLEALSEALGEATRCGTPFLRHLKN